MFLSFCVLEDFFPFFKIIWFLGILGPPGNHASQWIRDRWSKGVSQILAYLKFFGIFDDFFIFSKKIGFWGILCPTKHGGNHASRRIRDLWSKGVLLILSYFCVCGEFSRFSKKSGFWVILVHPPMASVLLSASIERWFVSRMRDFLIIAAGLSQTVWAGLI